MGLFSRKKEQIPPQPIVEEKKEKIEELRPLGEKTKLEEVEQMALTAKELYEMAETKLSMDPDNSELKKVRDDAYNQMINTQDAYKKAKMLGVK